MKFYIFLLIATVIFGAVIYFLFIREKKGSETIPQTGDVGVDFTTKIISLNDFY